MITKVPTLPLMVFSGPVAQRADVHTALERAGFQHRPEGVGPDGLPADPSHGLPSYPDPLAASEAGKPNAGHTPGTLHPATLDFLADDGESVEERENPLTEHHGKPYGADPTIGFLTFLGDMVDTARPVAERYGWSLRMHRAAGVMPKLPPDPPVIAELKEELARLRADNDAFREHLGIGPRVAGGAVHATPYAMQALSHSAEIFRQGISSLLGTAGGVLTAADYLVTQNGSPNMSVNIAGGDPGGQAWVPGTSAPSQSQYFVYNDASVNLAITASTAGDNRIDLVSLQVQDAAYAGSTNAASLADVNGTNTTGTAVAPSAPASSLTLAQISIPNGTTSITTSLITGKTSTVGFNPNLTPPTAKTPATGASGIVAATSTVAVRLPITAGLDPGGNVSSGRYNVPAAGIYLVSPWVELVSDTTIPTQIQALVYKNGSPSSTVPSFAAVITAAGTGAGTPTGTGFASCNAGDFLEVWGLTTGGTGVSIAGALAVTRVG